MHAVLDWKNYELIDAGGNKKLERWGGVITIRPEVNAYFSAKLSFSEWQEMAHWEFLENKQVKSGIWRPLKQNAPKSWNILFGDLSFRLQLTKYKHLGLFPEQCINWNYIMNHISEGDRFLNLFAYTGAASVVAKSCGADVIHVDAVKQLITWAKQNMEASHLEGIRWVHDDAFKFAERCKKRGQLFDCIIMDPPAFGIGANKERWKIEDKIEELLAITDAILAPKGKLIVNTYTPRLDEKQLAVIAQRVFQNKKTVVNLLWRETTSGKKLFYGNSLYVSDSR
jgi:23S rRNA (cytosine1962-C5)-methyltransferase